MLSSMKDQVKFFSFVFFIYRFIFMYTLTPVIQYLTSKIQYTDIFITSLFKGGFCNFKKTFKSQVCCGLFPVYFLFFSVAHIQN